MANTENKDPKKELKKRMVKALFSYSPVNIDELPLKVDDILEVIEETEEGWWKGILDGSVGMFPSNFVIELDGLPEELNNKVTNEASPTKNPPKMKNATQQELLNKYGNNILLQDKQDSKQVKTNSSTPDVVDGSSSSKCAPDLPPEKKMTTLTKKLSADAPAPRLPPKPVREQARVLFPYEAQNEDELTLKEGEIITVLSKEIEDKGWWKGELSNKIGVFPDNFVKLIKAEEQKKPERPDKPPTVVSSKNSMKSATSEKNASELSPKVDRKVSKTPPAKPPPPEIHKKEPDRPLPPCPNKKPQPPQPVKKPVRSSLGTKLSSSQTPTINPLKSSHSESTPSLVAALAASLEETTKSSLVASEKDKFVKGEIEFDTIESSGKKLVHLTANRAKAPNRRPPSVIFLKDNEKDYDVSKDSRRRSEPLLAELKTLLPLADSERKNSVSSTDMKPKVPPTRPALPLVKTNSTSKSVTDTIALNKGPNVNEESTAKVPESGKKDALPDKVPVLTKEILQPKVPELSATSTKPSLNTPSKASLGTPSKTSSNTAAKIAANLNAKISSSVAMKLTSNIITKPIASLATNVSSTNIPAETVSVKVSSSGIAPKASSIVPNIGLTDSAIPLKSDVPSIKDSFQPVMSNMVSKNEYNALLKQVNDLKESVEQLYKIHGKAISDLKEELDAEKRLRCAIESELKKLKECQNT